MLAVAVILVSVRGELTAIRIRDFKLQTETLHVVISKSGTEGLMPISSDLAAELRPLHP